MKTLSIIAALLLAGCYAQECEVYIPDHRDIIVIDAEQRGPGGGWEFMSDLPGYEGSGYLTYKPHSHIGWAEAKPQSMADERIKTYFFKVNTPGIYRVVIKSAAPHNTEHNDIFMSLPESGALKRRYGVTTDLSPALDPTADWNAWTPPEAWFKVYQNRGGLQWTWGGKTVDHHGHEIFTKELRADGTWYSVRICGRSTQFNVDRISLFLCSEYPCDHSTPQFYAATGGYGPKQSQCETPMAQPVSGEAATEPHVEWEVQA